MSTTSAMSDAPRAFLRHVSVLVSGTVLGHLVTALALVATTRLYTPADFSQLAVFVGAVAILSVAAALRFDIAVPVARTDADAARLMVLALGFSLAVCLLIAVAVLGLPVRALEHVGLGPIVSWAWLLPIGVFFVAAYSALQGWFVRRGAFGLIAQSRVGQSTAVAASQIALGMAGAGPAGLLLGQQLNTVTGCGVLGWRMARAEAHLFRAITLRSLHDAFKAYDRFPRYSTWEALFNSAAMNVPVILIATVAVGPEAGFLTLAMSVMQAPMSLVGTAIGQVYLSSAPTEQQRGTLAGFTLDTLSRLARLGVGPLVFAGILAPQAFSLVFGEDWRRAGEIVSWMTPWFVLQFLASPLSMSIHVTNHQRMALVLQVVGLLLRVASVWIASIYARQHVVEAYALSGALFYLLYLLVVLGAVRTPLPGVYRSLRSAWLPTLGWVLLAGFLGAAHSAFLG